MNSPVKYYSVRQLSPFVGNIQIVETRYCRALSSDGLQWQIQASCETHQQAWNISPQQYIPRRYVLYGSWNQKLGFSSFPLDPMLDVPDNKQVESTLIKALQNIRQLPFTQTDHYECWSIDQHTSLPLALLASASLPEMIDHIQIRRWQALPQQTCNSPLPVTLNPDSISQLEEQINRQSSAHRWFKRNKKGDATCLEDPAYRLSADAFSPLLFNIEKLPATLQLTATEYIRWQSPRLLSLQNISAKLRQQLEQQAQHFALETRQRMQTYPQPLPEPILNKIQVELKIRGL